MREIVGFDCGGTKTEVAVATPEGELLERFTVGGVNLNSMSEVAVRANLRSAFDRLDAGSVEALCFGAAGVSNPLTRRVLIEAAKEAGIQAEPILMGDHQAALWGAHAGGDGIILISGTGSVCCGKRGEAEARCGGWGHRIDDEGSGYAIGRAVLSAVVQAEDSRLPPTVMREAVFRRLNINSVPELISFIYDPCTGKREIAALAPLVMPGLAAGEQVAVDILERAAEQLAALVVPVASRLGLESGAVALCGSVLQKNEEVAKRVTVRLREALPDIRCVAPRYDAAYGAVLRAKEHLKSDSWRDQRGAGDHRTAQ